MKKRTKIITTTLLTLSIFGFSTPIFASNQFDAKAEAIAKLTNKTVETIIEQKNTLNMTFGEIAKENGVLDQFKKVNLEQKEEILNEKVNQGIITKEEAENILNQIRENQENCDGSGSNSQNLGLGLGLGNGNGSGNGSGRGNGSGNGVGNGGQGQGKGIGGMKLQDGSCYQ